MDNLDELFDGMPEPDAGLDFVTLPILRFG